MYIPSAVSTLGMDMCAMQKKSCFIYDDSLEGKMAADPLKNKKMLNKKKFSCFICCNGGVVRADAGLSSIP
jgi:hypothetical protein